MVWYCDRTFTRPVYVIPGETGRIIDVHDTDLPLVATGPDQRFRDEQHPFEMDDDGEPLSGPLTALVWTILAAALVALGVIFGLLVR